jgi:hypothetical protein
MRLVYRFPSNWKSFVVRGARPASKSVVTLDCKPSAGPRTDQPQPRSPSGVTARPALAPTPSSPGPANNHKRALSFSLSRAQSLGEHLASEAARADSHYRPYLDSLPSLADHRRALTWESLPPEYLHLLQGAAPLVRGSARSGPRGAAKRAEEGGRGLWGTARGGGCACRPCGVFDCTR